MKREIALIGDFPFLLACDSALLAGILSSCFAKKKVAKEEGDPRVGARCAGSLRYSAVWAAC